MAKQSKRHRLFRLNKGCCPIHGTGMPHVGDSEIYHGELWTLVGCPRRDCAILAYAKSYNGPWRIHPDFEQVINGAPED